MRLRTPSLRAIAALGMLSGGALAVGACDRFADRFGGAPADEPAGAMSGTEAFLRFGMVPFEPTRAGLGERFGAPDSTVVTAVKNRHDPEVTDSIAVLHYPGLAVEVYVATYGPTELTSSIRIADNRYVQETAPVRIGLATSELENVLGPATETDGGTRIYLCDTCTELGNDQLFLGTAGGRVHAITIQYSID